MADKPKKRMGRPPSHPQEGPGVFHLGLRLSEVRKEQLLALVEAANDRARAAGIPAAVTPSALVTHWIIERIDEETAKASRRR